ncbi:MAG: FKBP-type peptidyl-prolyl cis-trans isomerase [Elusimicrobia bacterium]|nr:FKBP-type peptidyl-prolyl cis-trans isomerase [Elusimicrobiota bacterium]
MTTALALAALLAAPARAAEAPSRAETLYALGAQVAQDYSLKPSEAKEVAAGLADAAAGRALKSDPAVLHSQLALLKVQAADAKREAELDRYAQEKGAERLPSGLIFKMIKKGDGPTPAATNTVKVDYTGTFPDGRVFDSSIKRGEPAEFPLGGVIPCWTQGVQMMPVGSEAQLVCPFNLAYGERGRPPVIPERATLVFDVHLLGIVR